MTGAESYRGRRVLVLGSSGFIGQWVAHSLAAGAADLHLAARDAGPGRVGVLHRGDLARPGVAAELVRGVKPAVVFNLAGYGVDPRETDPALARRINCDLVAELAEACAGAPDVSWAGQQLVHAGTAAEYGAAAGDLAEDTRPAPTSLYGRSKLAGTIALQSAGRARGLRGITARLFTVYGPGEREGRLLPELLTAARTRVPLALTDGSQQRDFTYVEDVAEALLRLGLLGDAALGPVNVATGRLTTVREFAERAAAVLELAPERLRFGARPSRPDEMRHQPVNLGRLRSLCRWTPPTTIEDGVRRTAQAG